MNYTPTSWKMDGLTVFALNAGGYNRFVLHVDPGNIDSGERTSYEELQANAKLIASAPEMHKALEAYQKANLIHNDAEQELFDQAEKALAKAES